MTDQPNVPPAAPVLAWHFLQADSRLQFGRRRLVTPGAHFRVKPPLVMCKHGLHASLRAIDALNYAPGPIVCRVKMSGTLLFDTDKLCASRRHVLWMADATTLLHHFACDVAEVTLEYERAVGREPDPRLWQAIKAKRDWMNGTIVISTLEDAIVAAGVASRAVLRTAAWAAACSAAGATWVNAEDAANAAIEPIAQETANTILEERLLRLAPASPEETAGP